MRTSKIRSMQNPMINEKKQYMYCLHFDIFHQDNDLIKEIILHNVDGSVENITFSVRETGQNFNLSRINIEINNRKINLKEIFSEKIINNKLNIEKYRDRIEYIINNFSCKDQPYLEIIYNN